jgi:phenylalanyl-tRNA synthetase beta chain
MKITYNLLKELVDFDFTPEELAEQLTMRGLEVEMVLPVKLPFSGIIVGKILDIKPHPNAQKLQLCKVTTGKEELQIVCGAHNIKVGDIVPAAVLGATLADNTKIIQRNIRGVDSFGMLCSEKELGLNEASEGIFILSHENTNKKDLRLGVSLEEAIGLNDTILEVNVTPNRPDALSITGIAREICSLTGNPLKLQKINFSETGPATKELAKVEISAWSLCPRYTARVIQNVKVKSSPFWLRYRLQLLGIRPVNNVVDITNYVLTECGQPLHAFDYKTINDSKIIVRTANTGEEITTIDNEERKLDNNILVIADNKKPIAIAGIIGGKETEVGEQTTDILLESAYFEPTQIRKTSKKFGISTEASYRFERNIDPAIQVYASGRAAQLIQLIAGGSISKEILNLEKNIPQPPSIEIDVPYCSRIIGIDIPSQKINSILKGIGCKIKKEKKNLIIIPPSWRSDITKRIDLIEEIARIYGYTKIPSHMPEAMVNAPAKQKTHELTKKLYPLLAGMGLSEIVSYSFIDPRDLSLLRIPEEKYMTLANPIDKNVCIMRPTLIPGIINNIIYNTNRGNDAIHVFEFGRCFFPNKNEIMPKEELHLAIGICGNPKEIHWRKSQTIVDFFYLKGILEELLRKSFIKNYEFKKIEDPLFCPGKACKIIIDDQEIGKFGELHPQVIRNFDIKANSIYTAELNISFLLNILENIKIDKFQPLPKFPSVRRDISIILDKARESHDIIELIQEMGSDIIENIEIFDVYEGNPIPEGKKSIAYAVFYRNKEKTLTDEEVDSIHNILRSKILEKTKGEIRE